MENKIRYFKSKDCGCVFSLELVEDDRGKFHWKYILRCRNHTNNINEATHNWGPEEYPHILEITKTEASITKLAGLEK